MLVLVISLLGSLLGCVKSSPPAPTTAPAAAPVSFEGKTITIIVAATAGGGTDLMGRIYAKYLSKFLPGNPTIIVRNLPGAEGFTGANHFGIQKPDGLTLFVGLGPVALGNLLGRSALKLSLLELTAIVGTADSLVYYVKPDIIGKPEDIVKAKGIRFGSGTGSDTMMFASAAEMIGFPVEKLVTAYAGGSEARRAFVSGELTACFIGTPLYAGQLKPLVDKGEAKILMQSGIVDEKGDILKSPNLPSDIMTMKELYEKIYGKSPSGMAYEAYKSILASVDSMKTPLLLPAGTPDNIARVYWDAAEKMIKDPEFIKGTVFQTGEGAKWMAGPTFNEMYRKQFGIKPEVRDWLKNLMRTKYSLILE